MEGDDSVVRNANLVSESRVVLAVVTTYAIRRPGRVLGSRRCCVRVGYGVLWAMNAGAACRGRTSCVVFFLCDQERC
jgi:hypothetical protein